MSGARVLPLWAADVDRALAVHPQFVISGNIRDLYPIALSGDRSFKPVLEVLWDVLAAKGCQFLLVYDPVDGLRVLRPDQAPAAQKVDGVRLNATGESESSPERLAAVLNSLSRFRETPGALVVDYASRLLERPLDMTPEQHRFFVACEKLSHQSRPLRSREASGLPFNPVVWLVNRPNDLPGWFTVANESIRTVVAGLPDREARRMVAEGAAAHFPDSGSLTAERRQELVDQFTLLTEGMTARSLLAIVELARDPRVGLARIADAIRAYKVGVPDDPWRQPIVRQRIAQASEGIGLRVKGQQAAVLKSVDILTRSVMGLTGAQNNRVGGRPRGVLFFAGPTGVGKTELAKAITQLMFGDESAYHRFDMSEFSAEQAEARLVGAPPGYVGYDAGGELVNAVRQRPFSVLLFDEIEKAHPRILDKFLQILEDGRLTDGRGETVFFSEAVIIFTSNLGIYTTAPDGTRCASVTAADDYEAIRDRVTKTIGDYFRFELQRPELLNRIGDNIVVFDFIRRDVASEIFGKMMANVERRVTEEHGIALHLSSETLREIEDKCLDNLEHGGRGIGNRLESFFINPLARALFSKSFERGASLTVETSSDETGPWTLTLK